MTVSSTINKITYLGDGTNRTFNIPFYVLKEADLSFVLINIETSEETYITSDYSVQAINYTFPSDTCELTYPIIASPMPEGYKLIIIRTVDIQQTTEFKQNASLQPKVVEQALDKQAMAMQQLEEEISRCIKASLASEVEPEELITELLGITATAAGYASAAQASATQTSADVVTAAASVAEAEEKVQDAQAIVDSLDFATQAEAEAGINTTSIMSPLTVKQSVIFNAPATPSATTLAEGKIQIATNSEVLAGTSTSKAVTPSSMRYGLNTTGNAPMFACRAWVNFNGTGTLAIRASGNVSSVTDNGTGNYTINFATPMPDNLYSVHIACRVDTSENAIKANGTIVGSSVEGYDTAVTTSSVHIRTGLASSGSYTDCDYVSVVIFR